MPSTPRGVLPWTAREAAALAVGATVGAGLVLAVLHHWRAGLDLAGLGLVLGAGLRTALPSRRAGALVVRSRAVDAAVLLGLGLGLLALTSSVPPG